MSKLTAGHLPPLLAAWERALANDAITVHDADAFIMKLHDLLLEHQVRIHTASRAKPAPIEETTT